MLQENETKQKRMLAKHEQYVLDLISGRQVLLNHMLDQLCDGLTLVKTDVEELNESLSFTRNDIDQRSLNTNENQSAKTRSMNR